MGFLRDLFFHLTRTAIIAVEICENARDDDSDGLIDLNDPDCKCDIVDLASLIPNPSFEEMNCCPSSVSQLHCATGWVQASEPTTDFIHTCEWLGWPEFPPPVPFPHGEGIMGFRDGRVLQINGTPEYNWKEYAGACLSQPLLADTPYVFQFYVGFVDRFKSPRINITFFGSTDCANLPFGVGDITFGCPTNGPGWTYLGSSYVNGDAGNKWVKATIHVTPQENISAIVIGPDCPPTQSSVSTYYFFDHLTLVDLKSFQLQITEQLHPCAEEFTLRIPEQPGATFQWYKEGIALLDETSPQLFKMHGEGDYQVRIHHGVSCSVTGVYRYSIPVHNTNEVKTICKEDAYLFGDNLLSEPGHYVDTFKTTHNCDSIVSLELHVSDILSDTVQVKIVEGEAYKIGKYRFNQEGDYLVQLVSSRGYDSIVLLRLDYYQIFIPNVFSPNGDGINDLFRIVGEEDQIEMYNLIVFDKWGNQIYNGPQWDGTLKGAYLNEGVFSYIATLRMNDGMNRQISGSVTMLK